MNAIKTISQRQAVFSAVQRVLGGEFPRKVVYEELPKEQLKAIHEDVVQQMLRREVDLRNAETRTEEWIRKYVPGLCNNWFRKDPDLNGGGKYEPKRPGSRAGAGDEQLNAMKGLLAQVTNPSDKVLIEQEIAARKEALKPKPKEIKVDALPEHLRHLVPVKS